MLRAAFRKPLPHIILIAAVGLLVYSNTFNVPFQWDERKYIIENPVVKNLTYFISPSKAKGLGLQYIYLRDRYMGYLTFALNYRLHGLDVRGYHIVNIALHILNAFLVYALVRLTVRALENLNPSRPPLNLKDGEGGVNQRWLPLFVSLLFVVHPIQTEAVNYIMARILLLMSFFYLTSIVLYVKWRLGTPPHPPLAKGGQRGGIVFYFLSLLCTVLAMRTKENAFTLPFAIALYEFMFFGGSIRKRLLYLSPYILTLPIIPLARIFSSESVSLYSLTRHAENIPRIGYLFSQFGAIVTYLRLLVVPVNQNFNYDYPLYNSFFSMNVILSFIFLSAVIGVGIYLYRRSSTIPAFRVMSFGIFWFFLVLSVESSIFPIPVILCEYRLYLPSFGIFMAATFGAAILIAKAGSNKLTNAAISLAVLTIIVFSYAAYTRNVAWRSVVSLWSDVVDKSPGNVFGHYNLAKAYHDAGNKDMAVEHYMRALKLDPFFAEAHNNLAAIYIGKGLIDNAIDHYKKTIALNPADANAYYNLGIALSARGRYLDAVEQYRIAIKLKPDFEQAHFNLALLYIQAGLPLQARNEFLTLLSINPGNNQARFFLDSLSPSSKMQN